MGSFFSQAGDVLVMEEVDSKVFNLRLIAFDKNGNLRYGAPERDRNDEIVKILSTEKNHRDEVDNPDKLWYIMDSVWVNAWLLYVHLDVDHAPGPGPCRNERLLLVSTDGTRPRPHNNLVMATAKRAGDYRRVTEETWRMFCLLYPGSGPEIVARFPSIVPTTPESLKAHNVVEGDVVGAELGMSDNGWYDPSDWTVRDEAASAKKKSAFFVAKQLGQAFNKVSNFFSEAGGSLGGRNQKQSGEIGVGAAPTPLAPPAAATSAAAAAPLAAAGGGASRSPRADSPLPSLPASAKAGGSAAPRDPIPVPPAALKPAPAATKAPLLAAKVLGTALAPAPLRRDNKVVGERRNEQFYEEMFFSEQEGESGADGALEMGGLFKRQSELNGENEMQPKG